jgi:heptosyltransferase-2
MRIAVFSPNLIGDTVMATPAFRALRHGFPSASLTLVCKPGVAPTLDGCPWFDDRIAFDPRSKDRARRTWPAIRALRRGRFDLAVLFPNSIRTGLVAWLGGARRRVGYDHGGRRPFLTDRLVPSRGPDGRRVPDPAVESYLRIVRHLGCPVDSTRLELFTTEADERAADLAFGRLGLDGPFACLNTGGAFGPAKAWPAESFASVARRLASEAGVSVLVLCGPAERDAARAIVAGADHPRVVSLADEPPSLGLSKACVRRSALMITTDSGPRHFAAAFGVPVVGLFGPTHIAWTRTYHPRAIHLRQPVPCGPCQRPVCPEGHHRCMRELSADAVLAASLRLLGRPPQPRPRPEPLAAEPAR